MAIKILNMVRVSVVGAPGTGTITLGAALQGFQDWPTGAAAVSAVNGDTTPYTLVDGPYVSGFWTNWETRNGIWDAIAGTLTRVPVESSNGGAAIDATATAQVWGSLFSQD